jgi:hypothetical protein
MVKIYIVFPVLIPSVIKVHQHVFVLLLNHPLYTQNLTQYTRPTIETYIRFKLLSDSTDVYRLNVVTETTNVLYLSDRLVII